MSNEKKDTKRNPFKWIWEKITKKEHVRDKLEKLTICDFNYRQINDFDDRQALKLEVVTNLENCENKLERLKQMRFKMIKEVKMLEHEKENTLSIDLPALFFFSSIILGVAIGRITSTDVGDISFKVAIVEAVLIVIGVTLVSFLYMALTIVTSKNCNWYHLEATQFSDILKTIIDEEIRDEEEKVLVTKLVKKVKTCKNNRLVEWRRRK